jgi:nucleoside-diphosphate-sugar epimerase
MRVFLTGATGFIGSAIIPELIQAGHQVIGLTRSEAGETSLRRAGVEPHRGHLEDLDSLRSGAAKADGVIHCAFIHDFSKFKENSEIDKRAIESLGAVLAGSDRPLIATSGLGPWAPGRATTEDDGPPADSPMPRVSEQTALSLLSKGVKASVMRLPQVHDPVKQGLVTLLVELARDKRASAYVGEGRNRWPAAHVRDVARLYRLALEKHEAGARYHAVAEEGVSLREIAEALGRGLEVPAVSVSVEQAPAHFGFLAMFAGADLSASSAKTRSRLGWQPTGPGLLDDLDRMDYSGGRSM